MGAMGAVPAPGLPSGASGIEMMQLLNKFYFFGSGARNGCAARPITPQRGFGYRNDRIIK
jgi:hypothetical protein